MKTRYLVLLALGGTFAYLMWRGRKPAQGAMPSDMGRDPAADPEQGYPYPIDDLQLFTPLPVRPPEEYTPVGLL